MSATEPKLVQVTVIFINPAQKPRIIEKVINGYLSEGYLNLYKENSTVHFNATLIDRFTTEVVNYNTGEPQQS